MARAESIGGRQVSLVARRRARFNLILVCAAFVLPLGIAVWLYATGWRPAATGNHGELVDPPLLLAELALQDHGGHALPPELLADGSWTLLVVGSGACDVVCRSSLLDSRQVRLALGKDRLRVRRLLLVDQPPDSGLVSEHPDLTVARLPAGSRLTGPAALWVVDPIGNAMLRFPQGFDAKGLLEDMRRLLKLSHIG